MVPTLISHRRDLSNRTTSWEVKLAGKGSKDKSYSLLHYNTSEKRFFLKKGHRSGRKMKGLVRKPRGQVYKTQNTRKKRILWTHLQAFGKDRLVTKGFKILE